MAKDGFFMYYTCDQRAKEFAHYIIDNNATVRKTAGQFKISKSTVHTVVTITNGLYGW